MFFEDSLKPWKREWRDAGVDMSFVRNWQKSYDKVRRQAPAQKESYAIAKKELLEVLSLLKKAEQIIVTGGGTKAGLSDFAKGMKQYQGHFNHEFLIGKADTDFQTTYTGIINLLGKDLDKEKELLILQSEIENLLALTDEALKKEIPRGEYLAFFYLEHKDEEVSNLPQREKLEKVQSIYVNDFIEPMTRELKGKLSDSRVKEIMEVELWS